MKQLIFLAFVILSFLIRAQDELIPVEDFGSNPGSLRMYLYVPQTISTHRPVPLVVALHGCSQDAEQLSIESGWNRLADKYGFIVLYPEQKRGNNVSRCFNWFHEEDIQFGGESASILQMVQYTGEHYTIQKDRIYTYGLSAGAAMAVALLAEYPEVFAGGASLAGGPYGLATNSVEAFRQMSNPENLSANLLADKVQSLHKDTAEYPFLVVLHGRTDKVVDFRNALQLVVQWSALMEVDPGKHSAHQLEGQPQVTRQVYGSDDAPAVVAYFIDQLGHSLPVDPGKGVMQGGATGTFASDIDFFSTYYIARDFGLIPRTE